MRLTTQISSDYQHNSMSAYTLKDLLETHGVSVVHPLANDLMFANDHAHYEGWSPYDTSLDYFESIADSSFHTVANSDGIIHGNTTLTIAYAISRNKPVILLAEPQLADDIDGGIARIIHEHGDKLIIADLIHLPSTELQEMLPRIAKPVDYHLTSRERSLVRSEIRAYFRNLLTPAAPAHVDLQAAAA
jgi:hypothetical protein